MKKVIIRMKLQKFKGISKIVLATGCVVAVASCKKIFDVEPKTSVDKTQMYRNVYDADAAVIGIYGKFMKLAKQYELLNELRADLMDITPKSDLYLRQLSEHNVTTDNPYIDPRPFYDVIVNCNDVLKNFIIMRQQSKLKEAEFNQRYSDVGAIRSWVYLQLGIQFGEIPYVTDPLADVKDLHNLANYPKLKLPQLIDSLVAFTESLPYLDNYPTGTTLMTTVDGYSTTKFFINKYMLLGDLYLWDGQYNKAAFSFRKIMDINGPTGESTAFYDQYKLSNGATNPAQSSINYSRQLDFSSLNYGPQSWRNLFERPASDAEFNNEWIWTLPFDKNFAPENPFIEMFSLNGGKYMVQPSKQAIDNWNSQTQVYTFASGTTTVPAVFRDNFPFDSRGVFTYTTVGGQNVIMKYLYNYAGLNGIPLDVFNKQGKWFLGRAATLHLHFAEAANRDGKYKLAYALVNRGIGFQYDSIPGLGGTRDVTNWMQTKLPDPYNFDARNGETPRYRNPWYRNQGIRGRAGLKLVTLPLTDSVTNVENMIMDENALELAYEGNRWQDLLRIAIRRNDPAYIADKIYNKLLKSGMSAGAASAARAKLLAGDYFLPYKW